jgi:hypothetical protein
MVMTLCLMKNCDQDPCFRTFRLGKRKLFHIKQKDIFLPLTYRFSENFSAGFSTFRWVARKRPTSSAFGLDVVHGGKGLSSFSAAIRGTNNKKGFSVYYAVLDAIIFNALSRASKNRLAPFSERAAQKRLSEVIFHKLLRRTVKQQRKFKFR